MTKTHTKKAKGTKAKNNKGKKSNLATKKTSFVDNIKAFFGLTKKAETIRFVIGLALICIALFLVVSFVSFIFNGKEDAVNIGIIEGVDPGEFADVKNSGGILGLRAANYFMQNGFGFMAIIIPLFTILVAMKLMKTHSVRITQQFINFAFLMIWGSVFLAFIFPDGLSIYIPGGAHGINICNYLTAKTGTIGLLIVLAVTMILFCIYLTSKTIEVIRRMTHVEKPIKNLAQKFRGANDEYLERDGDDNEGDNKSSLTESTLNGEVTQDSGYHDDEHAQVVDLGTYDGDGSTAETDTPLPSEEQNVMLSNPTDNNTDAESGEAIKLEIIEDLKEEEGENNFERGNLGTPYDPKLDFENYKYPTVDILKRYPDQDSTIDMEEQKANKERIITVLRNFGVEISSIKATIGPTITLYEITPGKGVKIAKIRNLEDDIALSLSAMGIRIIAPIPGKGTIGIEVPNAKPKIVSMESVINSRKFQECEYDLPIALGRTITNEIYIQDLAKMPHLLVAGATGQGKSVGLNAIITSLLYKKHPSELKFVLVDPKKVEFSIYAPLENNFMAEVAESEGDPVITDIDKVKHTLKSLCKEMDDRYMLLKSAHCRTIKEYNEKFKARRLNPEKGHHFLPYIVVIIDEFGDLIMVAGREIEHPITRLAQLARAVGMHMVIATQRPTTSIITGNIKANFPARMAFRVMATIDSRTILDANGAKQLIGRGDMLFLASGKLAERVQCAFIDTPEVEALNDFIGQQHSPLHPYELPEVDLSDDEFGNDSGRDCDGAAIRYDSMFVEVARYVVSGQQGSTSAIQRTFAIGYNRAGRLMDQLEKAKIVGPARGSKPRDVLVLDETDLNAKLEALHLI